MPEVGLASSRLYDPSNGVAGDRWCDVEWKTAAPRPSNHVGGNRGCGCLHGVPPAMDGSCV